MKKFLSLLLAVAMLITTVVVATVSVSAVDGDWSVYTVKSQYFAEYADVVRSVPGYEYTSEGLSMISVDDEGNSIWMDSSPYATFQTTDPVYIKDGVYLKVRVDQFTYDAGDRWFGFSIWDQPNVELGRQGDDYGYGVETLIRHRSSAGTDAENYDENDPKTWPGAKTHLEWYKDLEEGQRISCKNTSENDSLYNYEFDDQERPILTLRIEWDDVNECCVVFINDVPAPDDYNSALNRYFEEFGYMAYIGFTLQNNQIGGTAGCTILEYGTSEDDASIPMGDDFAEPVINTNEVADIADASTVAEGEPAIILNGRKNESNIASNPTSVLGNVITVKEDNSVNIIADINNMATIKYNVNNDTSYAVEDFPIALAITRNFCTCNYHDNDGDGVVDAECKCEESLNSLALVGDIKQESSSFSAMSGSLDHFEPFYVGDDFYNYFIFDWSTIEGISGRINGIRLDALTMKGTDPERNNFDICEIAFFRNVAEAEAYFEAYLKALTDEDIPDIDGEETDPENGEIPSEPDSGETETEGIYTGPDVNGYYRFVSHVDGEDKIWTSTNNGIGSSASRLTFISDVDGAISFYARTSSEATCDIFRVYVNGDEKIALSAETDYELYSINVSVGDEIVFEYKKDITVNRGDDKAYVKNIYFTAHTAYLPEVDEDETQTWPDENGYFGFECTKDGGDVIWTSNNQGVGGSTARMIIIAEKTGTMVFYAKVSSESSYDKLIVYHNGSEILYRSGNYTYEMVTLNVVEGDEIIFTYSKDGGSDVDYDTAWIKNIAYTDFETSVPNELPFEKPTESETETAVEDSTQVEDGTGVEGETETETETGSELATEQETFTAGEDGIYEFIEDENGNWMSTNNSQGNSIARKTITCDKTGLYNISVNISSEKICDKLVIYVGDEVVYTVSGDHSEKAKVYVSAGDVMTIEYIKDGSRDVGFDRVIISLTFKEGEVPGVDISNGSGSGSSGNKNEMSTEAETGISGDNAIISGCFATLGTGAVAVIVTAMISLCAFRKKED